MHVKTTVAALLLGLASFASQAQVPDCRILLDAAGTAQHVAEIVVAPSAPVTLEIHCNGSNNPSYVWSTGATTFSIDVTAPAAQGSTQTYGAAVTVNGSTQQLQGTVRVAAPGTPVCTLTRDPVGNVPVFTNVRITADCPGATSYQWTGGYDLRGANTSSVLHVNVVNDPAAGPVPIDVIATNANGAGVATGTTLTYTIAPPSCRVTAFPEGTIAPLDAVTLTMECDGTPTSYNWSNGATSRSMTVNLASTTSYEVTASNAAGTSPLLSHVVGVSPENPGLRNYTGHWWGQQFENGWGMTLNQHGDKIFGVVYFYDATGEPTWAVMPSGTWNANFTAYTGDLYSPQGTPFTAYDASQLTVAAPVGNMTLTFTGPTVGSASYRLGYTQFSPNGRQVTTYGYKRIEPLILNSGTNPSGINVADMWWGGSSQNGWGISINQRSSELFSAWFTYGADRRPTWFIVSGSTWNANSAPVTISKVTGAPWLGVPYDPARIAVSTVGQGTYSFADAANSAFNYTVNGAAGAKQITRQPF